MSVVMPSTFGSDISFKAGLTQTVEFSGTLCSCVISVNLQKVAVVSDKICLLWKFQSPMILPPGQSSFSKTVQVALPDNTNPPLAVYHYAVGNYFPRPNLCDVISVAEFDQAILKA